VRSRCNVCDLRDGDHAIWCSASPFNSGKRSYAPDPKPVSKKKGKRS